MSKTRLWTLPLALAAALAVGGCTGDSQSTATKEEENAFRNPSKTPPPEAGKIGGGPPPAAGQK